MAFYRSSVVVAEPYEDSQGPESPTETSPEELKAFYEDMERREILERKLSKRKSNSGASIWSRKSLKRSTTTPPVHPTPADLPRIPSTSNLQENNEHDEAGYSSETMERNNLPRLTTSRSVIADTPVNQAWAENGSWAAVPLPTFKVKYPLHNPMGPRWYKNHHLIPPSQKRPSMRPPTFFSPSFPPMHTSSSPEHVDDSAGSSRTPSHSPLPTPTSSQTLVGDGGKPRSRKTSQTTPDTVDLLDVTDPWGTNWHHQSPYDIGQTTTTASSDVYDIPNRTRRASMTAMQSRHKSVAPSPLSQSTSAVHLHPLQPEIHIPRKLSKRRTTPAAANIFSSQPGDIDRKAASVPATPIDHVPVVSPQEFLPSDSTSLPKRMSVAPAPPHSVTQQTPKKEKRGSMLNRLAKKFSILKKASDDQGPASDWWHHVDTHETKGYSNGPEPALAIGRLSPEKRHRDSVKRVPPPFVDYKDEPIPVEPAQHTDDRASLASLETPYLMGRLTITNPDLPGTPVPDDEAPLPPEKPKEIIQNQSHIDEQPSAQSPPQQPPAHLRDTSSDVRLRLDKPLPPPQSVTPDRTQSPSMQPPAQNESPKKTSSQSRSKRNIDLGSTSKAHGTDRASNARASITHDRSAEASTSMHQSKKPTRSHSRSDAAPTLAPAPIPFPTSRYIASPAVQEMEYEGSPLSTSSMLANPPTPCNHRLSIATSDQSGPTLPPKSIYEGKGPQKPTPANPSPARQTETFKLVRSSSGNVYASGETITAAGQQWEVVESIEAKGRKSSSKSKDKEPEHKSRDQEYRSKDNEQKSKDSVRRSKDYEQRPKDEPRSRDYEHRSRDQGHRPREEHRSRDQEQRPRDEHRSRDQEQRPRDEHKARDYERSSKDDQYRDNEQRSREYDRKSKDYEPRSNGAHRHEESSRYEEKSSRKREEYRERKPERKHTADTSSSSNHHSHSTSSRAQPVYVQPIYAPVQPPNLPPPPTLRLERNPSITARPTSELPSAADMNAMRAKESWEMERLWKARSMYGLEPNAPTNNVIPGSSSSSSKSDDVPTHNAVYGSSHTAYVVQTPFQAGLGSQIYHSMPTVPPPIIYSSPASIPSIPDSISSFEPYDYAYRSYTATSPSDFRTSPPMPRPPLTNPLPEPPREAPFELKGLKTTKPSNRHSNDYWTKYNGITTAH
ncbi:hypothetical protein GALMADRAFT_51774 [Galerina marginata CBS 339.88]|uniref:Uncharacterized protein n=1 Tax=Galerina marginata (strain CBS 339.88) TaxID=685588 RepID=A0A067U208_GALM3|nr:hypothetical protein GALMADRAFT_51774 [Galerina marginata CBS 339.88]